MLKYFCIAWSNGRRKFETENSELHTPIRHRERRCSRLTTRREIWGTSERPCGCSKGASTTCSKSMTYQRGPLSIANECKIENFFCFAETHKDLRANIWPRCRAMNENENQIKNFNAPESAAGVPCDDTLGVTVLCVGGAAGVCHWLARLLRRGWRLVIVKDPPRAWIVTGWKNSKRFTYACKQTDLAGPYLWQNRRMMTVR